MDLKKVLKVADRIVNLVIILIFVPMLLYGIYGIWDSQQVYKNSDPAVYEMYMPLDENKMSFDELQKINSEVLGWLIVDDTNISYPLVQAKDNSKYVNTDVFGNFSMSGSLFLDCSNKGDFSNKNNIIYGHAMDKKAMFGELKRFGEKTYFKKHKKGKLYYADKWHKIEFFAFVHVDAYDSIIYNPYLQDSDMYLNYVRNIAVNFREIPFDDGDDRYVALSTCSMGNTNGRDVLIGRVLDGGNIKGKPVFSDKKDMR